MARSVDQIEDSLRNTVRNTDNRMALDVGPVYDYLFKPVPPELASVETVVDNLKRYYSPNFASVATSTEARDFATNFGSGPSIGEFAKATVVYFRNTPPPIGRNFTVPIGALVATVDGTLVYRTTQTVTMSGDFSVTYFNPSSQRYEISVGVEAVASGIMYNIPSGNIKKMQPAINGFDGIYQISDADGGTEPEDSFEVASRVQEKFKGLEYNSFGGMVTNTKKTAPTLVEAVTIIRPTDRYEFRRLTGGPALDLYVNGSNISQFTEDYLASGGESVVYLDNTTATGVTLVLVNGAAVDSAGWIFVPDTSLEYQGSTRARPSIQFLTELEANDLVEITGLKNKLLDMIQSVYSGDNGLFKTDVLVRAFVDLPVVVSVEVRINDGDPDDLRGLIQATIVSVIEPTTIPTLILPDSVRSALRAIPEVEAVKILEFRRKIGSIDTVEAIVPYKNQIPKFDSVASNITVRL